MTMKLFGVDMSDLIADPGTPEYAREFADRLAAAAGLPEPRKTVRELLGLLEHLGHSDNVVTARAYKFLGEPMKIKCATCNGRGVYDSHPVDGRGPAMEFECYKCDGTGRLLAEHSPHE
jgi:hypothetical protein